MHSLADYPFDITVYDKDFNFTGFVVDPIYLNFVPSWWNQGYGSFMLSADNPHTEALQQKGARVVVCYRGQHLMSGPVRSYRGDLIKEKTASLTYQVLDDYRIAKNTLAFVRPAHVLAATSLSSLGQAWRPTGASAGAAGNVVGQYSYYLWPDGTPAAGGDPAVASAEEAIKRIVSQNVVDRLGRPVTMKPDLGRGGDPTDYLPTIRNESVAEAIQPIEDHSGLSLRFWQEKMGTTIFCDVAEPSTWGQVLTPESGIVSDGVYSVAAPDITRPIIGGPGETAARVYYGIEGSGYQTDLESDWGDVIEVFRESGSFDFEWPDGLDDQYKVAKYYGFQVDSGKYAKLVAMLESAVQDGLAAGPPMSTLQMKLSETDTFHFGGDDGVQLGQFVTVSVNGGEFTNQVTEAQIVFTRDNGLVVNPLVGGWAGDDDSDAQLAQALAGVAKALRRMSTRK